MRRPFVTPEGVDLQLELATAGARAGAFMLDALLIILILVAFTIVVAIMGFSGGGEVFAILWLVGFFLLRNFWFVLFEMGGRGATPGKRVMKLRVVARDGARLTGAAVVARNAMREIEVFLPLSFLAARAADGAADAALTIASLVWSGIFLFFPLFNRDRLRVGDLVAGTWVVQTRKADLSFCPAGGLGWDPSEALRPMGDKALVAQDIPQLLEQLKAAARPGSWRPVGRSIAQSFRHTARSNSQASTPAK